MFEDTHTVCNLLPPRSARPLALVAEAVLVDVDDAPAPARRPLRQRLGPVAELLERPRPVAVDDHVRLVQQLLKDLAPLGRLQVEVGRALAHVAVDLEEGHVAEVGARDLEHVGPVLAQDARHDGAGNDAAHFEDLDAREHAPVAPIGQRARRRGRLERLHGPGRKLPVDLALWFRTSAERSLRRHGGKGILREGCAKSPRACMP